MDRGMDVWGDVVQQTLKSVLHTQKWHKPSQMTDIGVWPDSPRMGRQIRPLNAKSMSGPSLRQQVTHEWFLDGGQMSEQGGVHGGHP